MSQIRNIVINSCQTSSGKTMDLPLSYQVFGKPLHEAPIVLVNHALTGNSKVCGDDGWWKDLIGAGKCIDTTAYTVLAFNIPGNGFHSQSLDDLKLDYKDFTARDVARLFAQGLDQLKINKLFAVIGGSVGGGIAWELAALRPKLIENLIPVAADWKATDWVIANCFIQDSILNNSSKPLSDARMHAMTLYRTPESFADKFNRTKRNKSLFNVESWLNHHGEKLTERFQVSAYKMVNQLLKTIDITQGNENFLEIASRIESNIHIITINSDLLFKTEENWNTYVDLRSIKENVTIGEIESIHGHDAFLIEYQQLSRLLRPVFHSEEKKSLISSYNYNLKRIA